MSLNNIYYNGFDDPDNKMNALQDINVNDIAIPGRLLRRKEFTNMNGYILQCYEEGRAGFRPQPRFNRYQMGLIGLALPPAGDPPVGDPLTAFRLTPDGDCIDSDAMFTIQNNNEILFNKKGVYLITYKVTRVNNDNKVITYLTLNNNDVIPRSYGSIQVSASTQSGTSTCITGIYNIDVNGVLRLWRKVISNPEVPLVLAPNGLTGATLAERSTSYISIIKIGD